MGNNTSSLPININMAKDMTGLSKNLRSESQIKGNSHPNVLELRDSIKRITNIKNNKVNTNFLNMVDKYNLQNFPDNIYFIFSFKERKDNPDR